MKHFEYVRPTKLKAALDVVTKEPNAVFIAGGTNLIDLMKRNIIAPEKLVDINKLPLKKIEKIGGQVRIGALALNSTVVKDKLIQEKFPLLVQALIAGASAQLRNMATVGGNIMQRTRCPYFYDTAFPCNKREPGSGCSALEGYNRQHAIFGFSNQCIAVHPSDMSVALTALDATVLVLGPKGERRISFSEFYRLPGNTPHLDTNLEKEELILAVELPESSFSEHVHYLKVRDRASFAFALVSVAAALNLEYNTIKEARLAMGGVAHKPWRLVEAEKSLVGKPITEKNFRAAAEIGMQGAKAFEHNAYKLKMGTNAIVQALKTAARIV